ncbi:MAG: hypothetical protein ACYDCK_10960 [Thermoplasmatota archaeon]
MTFETDLPDIVRAVSGVLWAGLGGALLIRRRQHPEVRWLAIFFLLLAPDIIGFNLLRLLGLGGSPAYSADEFAAAVTETIGAILLLLSIRTEAARRPTAWQEATPGLIAAGLAGIAEVVTYAMAAQALGVSLRAPAILANAAVNITEVVSFTLLSTLGLVFAHRSLAERNAGIGWVAFALLPFSAARAATYFIVPTAGTIGSIAVPFILVGLAMTIPFVVGNVVLACRARSRVPTLPAIALGLALDAFVLLIVLVIARYDDVVGFAGIARLVTFGLIGYAFLRFDPFSAAPRASSSPRVAAAPVALALVFIVAQVAQNFFAAQYGLLLGGIVAGTFLFAASPIQHAIEGRRVALPRPSGGPNAAREASFRAAIKMALKDGTITREEERHLIVLAEHLGIAPSRAYELRDEVAREYGKPQ